MSGEDAKQRSAAVGMAYVIYALHEWSRSQSPADRKSWAEALSPLGVAWPWPEDLEKFESGSSARSYEEWRKPLTSTEAILHTSKSWGADEAEVQRLLVKERHLPGLRPIGASLLAKLPPPVAAASREVARREGLPVTDGLLLEALFAAAAASWALNRVPKVRLRAVAVAAGYETVSGTDWSFRIDVSETRWVEWWLNIGTHSSHSMGWVGANLEVLAAVAPEEQLLELVTTLGESQHRWLAEVASFFAPHELRDLLVEFVEHAGLDRTRKSTVATAIALAAASTEFEDLFKTVPKQAHGARAGCFANLFVLLVSVAMGAYVAFQLIV